MLRKISTYIWCKLTCPIWSLILNSIYWLRHISDYRYSRNEKEWIETHTKTLDDVKQQLLDFKYQTDRFKDWRPWVLTLLSEHCHDDCDGAAIYAKWLLSLININSKVVYIFGDTYGHAICLYNDHTNFVSNGHIINIENPKNYKKEIYNHFNNKYSWMIK